MYLITILVFKQIRNITIFISKAEILSDKDAIQSVLKTNTEYYKTKNLLR